MKAPATSLGVCFCLAAFFTPMAAMAQSARSYNMPAQTLSESLRELGSQAQVNVIFDPAAIANRKAPILRGNYDLKKALAILLKGSNFTADFTGANTVTIKPISSSTSPSTIGGKDSRTLSTVVVTGVAQALTATRSETPVKEVPQSVSIISRDTLDQQNATDLASALQQATGITLVQSSSQQTYFYSRGFMIDSIHIDGGAPLTILQGSVDATQRDMAEFSGIEILRGSDALFGGMGNPGATVSLQRKDPTDTPQGEVDLSLGSWNQRRFMGDISGPLASGLSGRLVVSGDSQDYFYKTANSREGMIYGVLKYEISPSTTVELGGSYEKMLAINNFTGLPWFDNGDTPRFPIQTSLTAPWARGSTAYTEGFAKFDTHFSDNWALKSNATFMNEDIPNYTTAGFSGPISSITGLLNSSLTANASKISDKQMMFDTTLTGAFDLFGQKQEVMIGGDFQHELSPSTLESTLPTGPLIDPFAFDPSVYPQPSLSPSNILLTASSSLNTVQWGVYGAFRFHPIQDLAITVGGRISEYRSNEVIATSVFGQPLPVSVNDFKQPTKFTPYAGITYDLNPNITLYASYADIYHTNNGEMTKTFSQLPPSNGVNIEAGVKGAWFDKTLNASFALFKVDQSGNGTLDPTVPPNFNCCFVRQSVKSKGFETELTGAITPNWQLTAGYTYDIHEAISPYYNEVLPRNLFKLWTNYILPTSSLSIGGGIRAQSANFVSECTAYTADGSCATFVRFHQGFYPVADFRVAYALDSRWNLSLNLNNLFNRRYYQTLGELEFGNWYGAPRNFMLKLQGKF